MAKKNVVVEKTQRTSPLFERLEKIRIKLKFASKYSFAKRIGLTPIQYDQTKDTKNITPSWEIACQALESDTDIDWFTPPDKATKK